MFPAVSNSILYIRRKTHIHTRNPGMYLGCPLPTTDRTGHLVVTRHRPQQRETGPTCVQPFTGRYLRLFLYPSKLQLFMCCAFGYEADIILLQSVKLSRAASETMMPLAAVRII